MCEPPSDDARTAALWGWQAPDRDYPMSIDREIMLDLRIIPLLLGHRTLNTTPRYLRIATSKVCARPVRTEALHTMTAKEPALMPA